MVSLPDGKKISKICLFVLTWSTNVTDRRTDGQTDTARQQRPRICIASSGKNHDDMFIRFDRIQVCARQTDRRREGQTFIFLQHSPAIAIAIYTYMYVCVYSLPVCTDPGQNATRTKCLPFWIRFPILNAEILAQFVDFRRQFEGFGGTLGILYLKKIILTPKGTILCDSTCFSYVVKIRQGVWPV